MDFDLSPNCPQKTLFDGEGGSYKAWSSSDLATAKVGGGELVLKPRGFALPHYADSSKFGTEGIVGMVLPNTSKEVVLRLKKGDVIPVPLGGSSWWYNNGDSDFVIVFLGETSKAFVPGEFTYFLLSGTVGLVGGFSSEFTRQAYNLNEKEANKLAKSQTGMLIIKLEEGIRMPNPHDKDFLDKLLYNIDAAPADLEVPRAGVFKTLTAAKLQCLEQVGLSVSLVKLSANAMYSPTCTANGSIDLFMLLKEVAKYRWLASMAGQLFLVPRFFTVAEIAGSEGMKLLSMTNSTWPVIEEFATEKSVWNAMSPIVAQVALNVTPEFEELFKSNINKSSIIIPPSN
ncbi:nutrient reservoir, putative [Ricinus communis]|uniref:Nutrient reservoir, putative n=1 Tax=Ricinus communis TaxID=3988 RepID=B9STF8_RICCO|nr:nutrient reservoir, putative [Ricinus communis]